MKIRTLKAGTTLHGKGSALPFTLAEDAKVNFPVDSDEAFVGWLLPYGPNYDLNIVSVEGNWDRVTGRRIPPEKPVVEPKASTPALMAAAAKPVPPLVQAIRLAHKNQWSDALASYNAAKLSLALTDEELVAKGNSPGEKTILQNLADGVDDKGNEIFLAGEKTADPIVKPTSGRLPADFPGHDALANAGINTFGQLNKVEELTSIPGIGDATAARIKEALAK